MALREAIEHNSRAKQASLRRHHGTTLGPACSWAHQMDTKPGPCEGWITLPFFLPRPRRAAPPLGGPGCGSGSGALLGKPATARPRDDGRLIFGDPACLGLPAAADALVSPSSCSLGNAFIVTDTYLQHMSMSHLRVVMKAIATGAPDARLAQPGSSCSRSRARVRMGVAVCVCVCVCVCGIVCQAE